MDAGFQAQEANSTGSGIVCQMIEQQPRETETPKLRAHVHTLYFPIGRAEQLDAAAAGGSIVLAQYEKGDCVRKQLLDAKTMTAFGWIERVEMRFMLRDQGDGVVAVGALG